MTQKQELDYTDEAWWMPPAFDMNDDQLVQLKDIVESDDLEDYFYPNPPPKCIQRRYDQFTVDPIFSYHAECFGYGSLDVLVDKEHNQTVLITSGSMGAEVLERLVNKSVDTLWPYIQAYLLTAGPLDGTITVNKDLSCDYQKYEPWNYSFWIGEFSFYGCYQLKTRFKRFLSDLYEQAPEDCNLKQGVAPTAEKWLEIHGI